MEVRIEGMAYVRPSDVRGNGEAICYDFNANCVGLIEVCNHVCCCMMKDDTIKKALIVGMDYNSTQCGHEGNLVATLADTACAMVLKVSDEKKGKD